MWTKFMDMHSGGGTKEPPYENIYIEADEEEAVTIFYNRFGHNPYRVTCTCCGADYSVDTSKTLDQASGFDRGCMWIKGEGYIEEPSTRYSFNQYQTLDEFKLKEDTLIITKEDIKDEERVGDVPEQGYVWL